MGIANIYPELGKLGKANIYPELGKLGKVNIYPLARQTRHGQHLS